MICLAHPDDESFGMGGTIATYAKQGVEITLVCATRGEAGTVDKKYLQGFEDIAALRTAELYCAAETLGIAETIFLGYRDSGMQASAENEHPQAFVNADIKEVSQKILHLIEKKRPQIILTFDSTGGYHHPDHIAIHHATLLAFEQAKNKAAKGEGKYFPSALYTNARSRKRIRRMVRLLKMMGKDPRRMGRNNDIDLTQMANDGDTPVHVSIDYQRVLKEKEAADRCHASQYGENGLSLGSLLRLFRRFGGNHDEFTRIFPPAADDFRTRDLFDFGAD